MLYANVLHPVIAGGIIVAFDELYGNVYVEQHEEEEWVHISDIVDVQALDEDWTKMRLVYSKERGDTEQELCRFLSEHFEKED